MLMSRDLSPAWRVPLLVLAMISLVAGAGMGLARLGWSVPHTITNSAGGHGPLMICGFFGTVIGLERAVAIGARWAYLGPLLSGLGGLALGLGLDGAFAAMALSAGSLVLLLASVLVFRRQRALHTFTLVLGTAAWLAGNLLWMAGVSIHAVVSFWMSFLVLTIAGERLELSRLLPPSSAAKWVFSAILLVMVTGMAVSLIQLAAGTAVFAAALLALALWLLRQDIARRTVGQQGLTRFIAVCLLSGYGWLAAGALIACLAGGILPGRPGYDAALHAILLGFVFSMVFGHAPIIFPAVLRVRVPYSGLFYGPLTLLHISVATRVVGALGSEVQWRSVGGLLNAAALLLFVVTMISAVVRGRLARQDSR
jgi:hypothetical protein